MELLAEFTIIPPVNSPDENSPVENSPVFINAFFVHYSLEMKRELVIP